jgi:flagellar biosynthetic protein FlhB
VSEDKTEKATPKRRKESRKKGQVPRTQELGGWATVLLWSLALPPVMSYEIDQLRAITVSSLRSVEAPTTDQALALLGAALGHVFAALVAMGAAAMVIGVGAALMQGGFFVATESVKPSLAKLDPIKGAKRVFGPHALWEGAKVLVKAAVVGVLVYRALTDLMPVLGSERSMGYVLSAVGDHALDLLRTVALAGLLMGAADYAVQRRRVGKQTRMTKDEVRREHKQTEGDPLVKNAIRSRQLSASRQRMIADVPHADVVLVNPTHVAVALRYDPARGAPTVVARGAGTIAARIREVAAEHDVATVRDVPLARALFASTEVGQEIPPELFAAVAQVLAFVISRRGRGQPGGDHRSPRREHPLPELPRSGRRRRISSGAAPAGR